MITDKEKIKSLIHQLKSPQWKERKEAAEKLIQMGEDVVEYLAKTLQFENEDIRYWATIVLAKIGGKGIDPLIEQLETSPDKEMRLFCAKALGETKDKRAIPSLIKALEDKSWNVRKTSAEGLKNMGREVLPYLKQALNSGSEDAKFWTIKILGDLGNIGIKPLVTILEKSHPQLQALAAEALGETRSEEAVPHLINALTSESWSVRKNAAKSLEKLGERAIPYLVKELETPDENIRYWIIKILGTLGRKAVDEIISHLEDKAGVSRFTAQEVFSKMGKDAIEPLIKLLKHEDRQIRKNAAEALGNTKDPEAIPVLINSLGDESWFVRKAAAMALEEFGKIAIEELTRALESDNEDIQFWATRILSKIGVEDYRPLLRVFSEGNKEARFFALEALGKSDDQNIVKFLISALADSSWPIRRKAADILIEMGEKALPEVIKNLKNANNDIRYWCIQILNSLSEDSLSYILKLLNHIDIESKLYAICALGELKDKRSLEVLKEYLFYPDEWIRKASLEAMMSIDPEFTLEYLFKLLEDSKVSDIENILMWIPRKISDLTGELESLLFGLLEKYSWDALNFRQKKFILEILKSLEFPEEYQSRLLELFSEVQQRDVGVVTDTFLRIPFNENFMRWLLELVKRNPLFMGGVKKYIFIHEVRAVPFLKRELENANPEKKEIISNLLVGTGK